MNPTTALACSQQALIDTLFAPPDTPQAHEAAGRLASLIDHRHAQSARGLLAYRANGHALAEGDAAVAADRVTADTEGFLYAARLFAA